MLAATLTTRKYKISTENAKISAENALLCIIPQEYNFLTPQELKSQPPPPFLSSPPPRIFFSHKATNSPSLAMVLSYGFKARGDVDPMNPSSFELYGWSPLSSLSVERNYLDLALITCRSSICLEGFMGCVITEPTEGLKMVTREDYFSKILSMHVNSPFFSEYSSEVHAELHAVSTAAKNGVALDGATAYISMPPCKNCFWTLVSAGVKKVVSRKRVVETIRQWLDDPVKNPDGEGKVIFVELPDTDESKDRVCKLVSSSNKVDMDKVRQERKRRKEAAKLQKAAKAQRRATREEGKRMKIEQKQKAGNAANISQTAIISDDKCEPSC